MTTSILAEKLDAHPKAVDGHLSRMTKADSAEVVKLGRGLYALPSKQYTVAAQTPKVASQNPRAESFSMTDITDGVADWKQPPVLEARRLSPVKMPYEGPTRSAPDLKCAEPRWDRKR